MKKLKGPLPQDPLAAAVALTSAEPAASVADSQANTFNPDASADNAVFQEITRLVRAMMEGQLGERGQVKQFEGSAAELISLINLMLDTLITPLRAAAYSIDRIAHGNLPDFITDEYKGEFNEIKRNLNTFLAIMYGMHHETQSLIKSVQAGKLAMRGNDWDFQGNWQQLIAGVNDTLDAVINPIQEASAVLGQMSNYDLSARVSGGYKGDHARIKKALNTTADTLQAALYQVAEAVAKVTAVSENIAESSEAVARGAGEQADAIRETSRRIEQIASMAKQNQENTAQAAIIAHAAKEAVAKSKDSTARLSAAIGDIRASAEGTSIIIQEIDTIALKTDSLAADAAVKAAHIGSAGQGFSVLANEMRDLAKRSMQAATTMEEIIKKSGEEVRATGHSTSWKGLNQVIKDINMMARQTNYLAVNAAVQAAHIEATGTGFESFTEEVRRLSVRTKDAAVKTEGFIHSSVELAQNGEVIFREIDHNLVEMVEGVTKVADIVERIAVASQDQTEGVEAVNVSISHVQQVTEQFAVNAEQSSSAARTLEGQARDLQTMVERFHLGALTEKKTEKQKKRHLDA